MTTAHGGTVPTFRTGCWDGANAPSEPWPRWWPLLSAGRVDPADGQTRRDPGPVPLHHRRAAVGQLGHEL